MAKFLHPFKHHDAVSKNTPRPGSCASSQFQAFHPHFASICHIENRNAAVGSILDY